jgi:probable F420-dependent oxidoreductase
MDTLVGVGRAGRASCASVHTFRFAATMPPPAAPLHRWRADLRALEDLGISTVVAADHFTQGYAFEPMVALTAAAGCTTTLRLQTGVLGNDYRHPVLVHRMAAVLDVVSEGRLTLGLGAGWMTSDYEAAGIPLDPPAVRVDRFEEAVAVVIGLFADEPFDFVGEHYEIKGLDGLPKPVQRPHPPLFVGGGSRRVLGIAGRRADVVGINASLGAGELGAHAINDLSAPRVREKIGWVLDSADAAGRPRDAVELEMNHWLAKVTPTAAAARDLLDRVARRNGVDPDLLASSPAVLVGTTSQLVDTLRARRAELGISHLQLDAGFPTPDLQAFGPVIAELAETSEAPG